MEQSPLSRIIRELEADLGVQLFLRTTRSTRLTRAGQMLLTHVPRVFDALDTAREGVRAVANGFHEQFRIALSDGGGRSRLPALLALCRQERPEVELRLVEVPLSRQLQGLRDHLYDVGFSLTEEVDEGISAQPLWSEPLMAVVPERHPLLGYRRIPPEEMMRYPLVLWDRDACEGHARVVDRLLRQLEHAPRVVDRVTSVELMTTLVSAGLALGLAGESYACASRTTGIVARPLSGKVPMVTTYLLRQNVEPSAMLARFIESASAIGLWVSGNSIDRSLSDSEEGVES